MALKDLEDDARAVEDFGARGTLQIARLRGREIMIHENDRGACGERAAGRTAECTARWLDELVVVLIVERLVLFIVTGVDLALLADRARWNDAASACPRCELLELAVAEHGIGGEVIALLGHAPDWLKSEGRCETLKLLEGRGVLRLGHPTELHADDDRLGPLLGIDFSTFGTTHMTSSISWSAGDRERAG